MAVIGNSLTVPFTVSGGTGAGQGPASGDLTYTHSVTGEAPATGGGGGGTPPEFVGSTAITSGTTSSLATQPPTGVQAGDFQLVIIGIGTASESITGVPAGWTQVATLPNDGGDSFSTHVFASTTDTGVATFTRDGARGAQVVRLAWRGQAGFGTGHIQATSGTSHAIVTETTTTGNSWVIGVVHTDGTGGMSFTPPAGWTERYDFVTSSEESQAITVADFEQASPGPVAGSFTSSASDDANVFSIVLDAAAAAAPTGAAAGLYQFDEGGSTGEQPPGAGASSGQAIWGTSAAGVKVPKGAPNARVYAFDQQNAGKRVPKGSRSGGFAYDLATATGFDPSINTGLGSYTYTPGPLSGTADRSGSTGGTVDHTGAADGSNIGGNAAGGYGFAGDVVGQTPLMANDGSAGGGYDYDLPPGAGAVALFGTVDATYDATGVVLGQEPAVLAHVGSVSRGLIFNHGNVFGTRSSKGTTTKAYDASGSAAGKGTSIIYQFTPPTYELVVPDRRPPYKLVWSLSVIRIDGVLTEWHTPTGRMLDDAGQEGVDWFLGGHVYHVSKDVSDELEASGFTTTRV